MNIKLINICFIIFFNSISINAFEYNYNKYCKDLLLSKAIDCKIKSVKGWQRVCNNNKIELYTPYDLTELEKKIICECLKCGDKIKPRVIGSTLIEGEK